MLENLIADVRFTLRWLRRSPAFTLIAVASLAIGIGFNTALFTIVDALVFRPLPVDRDRCPVHVPVVFGFSRTLIDDHHPARTASHSPVPSATPTATMTRMLGVKYG